MKRIYLIHLSTVLMEFQMLKQVK